MQTPPPPWHLPQGDQTTKFPRCSCEVSAGEQWRSFRGRPQFKKPSTHPRGSASSRLRNAGVLTFARPRRDLQSTHIDYVTEKSQRFRYPSGATVISSLSGMALSMTNSGCDARNSCTAVFGLSPGPQWAVGEHALRHVLDDRVNDRVVTASLDRGPLRTRIPVYCVVVGRSRLKSISKVGAADPLKRFP